MFIKRIPAGIYAANCYIVMDEISKDIILIDIGGDAEDIIKEVKNLNGNVRGIILTHGHVDHVSGVLDFKEEYDVPVYLSHKDEELMIQGTYIYGSFNDKRADFSLKEGEVITLGSIKINVLETPGHTPGGVSFIIEDNVFTGDSLFYGSIGRTDLSGGNYGELIDSIKDKLLVLPEETKVYSGHGPMSTVGNEKRSNPFLR
ncbi:MBL fold metallo-hydrolase [Clostridium hydrogeniformans]|uniref:MBL fold metallo-hydrolase n=1 Tax=Clostridium hydrogeniformans TaxID=349933 RepID=UPI000483A900|nr:MBL fold metallo-hydrolase [Clostridium hydrogeniformans]